MVILVARKHIESHPTEHFLNLPGILCKIPCQMKQIRVVKFREMNGFIHQGTGSRHMKTQTILHIKPSGSKISSVNQPEVRNRYACLSGRHVVTVFHHAHIRRI